MPLDSSDAPDGGREDRDELESLGRPGRTFRQWRLSFAPVGWALFGAIVAYISASAFQEWAPPQLWWLLLIPLGLVIGLAVNYFEHIPHSHGRLRLTVYERGLHIRPEHGAPVVLPGPYSDHLKESVDEDFLCLKWVERDRWGTVWTTPIESFAFHRVLERALRSNRRPSAFAGRLLPTAVTGAAVLGWVFLWSISPLAPVPPVPGHERDLARFCDDGDLVFEDAQPYEGAGPHAIGFAIEEGHIEGSESAARETRGWSTGLADVELIACGRPEPARTVDSCAYGNLPNGVSRWTFALEAVDYRFTVYEAATHEEVGIVTVEPSTGDLQCPPSITVMEGDESEREMAVRPSWVTVLMTFGPYAGSEANTW